MSVKWITIQENFKQIKLTFDRSFKCLNRSKLPSEAVQIKHLKILVGAHNESIGLIRKIYYTLSEQHKSEVKNFLTNIKSKLEVLFARLDIQEQVPKNFQDIIDIRFKNLEDQNSDSGSETETEENPESSLIETTPKSNNSDTISANESEPSPSKPGLFNISVVENFSNKMSQAEFLNLAAKLLPDYDSSPENLNKFLNAINLVDSIKDTHEEIAVSLIKTKISGKTQNIVSQLTSISEIKEAIKKNVTQESASTVSAKLMAIKQNGRDTNAFVKEIENLTQQLENAYIVDGLPTNTAQKYATGVAVKSLANNARSAETKIVMKAGNFTSVSEAITKFVDASAEASTSQINYVQQNKFRTNPNIRGRGGRYFNNSRGRYNFHQRLQNTQNRGNYNQGQFQNRRNVPNQRYNGNRNRGSQFRQNVRQIEAAPENQTAPQLELGEYLEN